MNIIRIDDMTIAEADKQSVLREAESDNPLFELDRRFEEIKSKSTSLAISCGKVIEKMEQLNVTDVGGMGAYEVHYKLEALLEALVRLYAKLGLRSDYLVQQKTESQSVVRSRSIEWFAKSPASRIQMKSRSDEQ